MSGDVRQAGITSRPATSPLSVFGPEPGPSKVQAKETPDRPPSFQQQDQLSLSSRPPSVPVARTVSLVTAPPSAEGPLTNPMFSAKPHPKKKVFLPPWGVF